MFGRQVDQIEPGCRSMAVFGMLPVNPLTSEGTAGSGLITPLGKKCSLGFNSQHFCVYLMNIRTIHEMITLTP
jgi:hypothetical protein